MKRAIDAPTRRYPVEERLDHILVHLILRVIEYSILGLIVFTIIYVFFTTQALPWKPTAVMQGMIAIVMLGFGWGVFNLVLSKLWRFWIFIFPPLNRILILFSGVLHLVDFMSPTARYVMSYVPLVHAVSLFRMGFYPNQPTLILDTNYLWMCSIIAVATGLALERVTRRSE
jgi:capsular polysaccharide transport system permease protein